MTGENKRHNIALEVKHARQDLQDACLLRDAQSHGSAVSKAYYSMFHYARALILLDGLEARSHSGVIHLVNLHFVKAGRFSPEVARWLSQYEMLRENADYDSAAVFTESISEDAITAASDYGEAVCNALRAAGYLTV